MDEAAQSVTSQRWFDWFLRPRVLDRLEQIGIVTLWLGLAWRVSHADNFLAFLALVSEATILIFTLLRRPTGDISVRLGDWMLAITATCMPLMVIMVDAPLPGLSWLAIALVTGGTIFQVSAKLALNRSFGIAPANRGVKTSGPYKFVRHPMYTGYMCAQIGVLIALPSLINVMIIGIGWVAQILRLQREEAYLSQDPQYRDMMKVVRWRLLPGVY